MSYLSSVPKPLCDPLALQKHNDFTVKEQENLIPSFFALLNRGLTVVSNHYWSSTTNASNTDNAWNVNFNNGNDNWNNKSNTNYVRCVRSADNGRSGQNV